MASVAEFRLDAEDFPLGTVFANLPDVTVHLERVVPGRDRVIPYFWVRGAGPDCVIEAFASHPGVRDIRAVDRVDGDHLLRCEWVPDQASVLDALATEDVVLLSAVGSADEWTFELRGESREAIAAFQAYCHDHGIPVELTGLHALRAVDATDSLTDAQREALSLAYEHGYFDSPRAATLSELADELGITQQALGSRLQRATRRLVERAVGGGSDDR